MTTHQQAHKDYLNGMKYKDIAEKYGVSLATVKSWKTRYGWFREYNQKKVCIQKIKVRIQENEGASLVIIMHYTMLVVRLNKIKMLLSTDC